MYLQILSKEQQFILPKLKHFKNKFYLVGGTAIALQIGHRESIDFDLFSYNPFNNNLILKKIKSLKLNIISTYNEIGHFDLLSQGVKITFFNYNYKIDHYLKIIFYLCLIY